MKIYVVKYALTEGIFEAEAGVDGDGRAYVRQDGVLKYFLYRKDYALNPFDADSKPTPCATRK